MQRPGCGSEALGSIHSTKNKKRGKNVKAYSESDTPLRDRQASKMSKKKGTFPFPPSVCLKVPGGPPRGGSTHMAEGGTGVPSCSGTGQALFFLASLWERVVWVSGFGVKIDLKGLDWSQ